MLVRELIDEPEERNYAKQPLTKAEVTRILKALSVADLLNTRHKVAKENGWKEKPPSKTAFTAAVLKEPNLIRRPIVLHEGEGVVGKAEGPIRALLEG